jgi:iron complex transport system permease protein
MEMLKSKLFALKERTTWRIYILSIFLLLAITGIIVSTSFGAVQVGFRELVGTIFLQEESEYSNVIWNIRFPRTLVGALVGINLAIAGALLQGLMKNPLADPHIIGINSGAGLAGVIMIILFPTMGFLMTPAAFLGAMFAAVLIYFLAWKNGIQPTRVILAGVAISALFSAGISGLMIFYSDRVHGALMWLAGGLSSRSWPQFDTILPYTIIGMIIALLGAKHMNAMLLGDDTAKSLGVRVEYTRLVMTAVAALLAASAVSVVGLLGFVGLIVPHSARILIGSDYRYLLPASALLGVAIVTLSDTVARMAFAPVEIPVGVIMAVLGAPFFLYLLRRV